MIRTDPHRRWMRWILFGLPSLIVVVILYFVWSQKNVAPITEFDRQLEIADESRAEGEKYFERQFAEGKVDRTNVAAALAWLRGRRDAWDEAEALIKEINLNEVRSDLLLRLARTAERFDQHVLAARVLAPVRERTGIDQIQALELTWSAYSRLGDFDAAYPVGRKLIELDPGNFARRMQVIQAMQSLNLTVDCLREIDDALNSDPPPAGRTSLEFAKLDVLVEMGRNQDAWKLVPKLEKQSAEAVRLKAKLVDLLRLDGRFEEALQKANEILTPASQSPAAYLSRAMILVELSRYAEAISDLEKVVSIEPYNERALFKLSEAYRNSGDQDLAGKYRQRGIDIRNKRTQINELVKLQTSPEFDRTHCEELAKLNQDVGAASTAAYWQQKAESFKRRRN